MCSLLVILPTLQKIRRIAVRNKVKSLKKYLLNVLLLSVFVPYIKRNKFYRKEIIHVGIYCQSSKKEKRAKSVVPEGERRFED